MIARTSYLYFRNFFSVDMRAMRYGVYFALYVFQFIEKFTRSYDRAEQHCSTYWVPL